MTDLPEALVRRWLTRDPAAVAELVELYRPQLRAFIENQLGQQLRRKVEPDDVFQEAFAEALRSLPSAELAGREPFRWLCMIAEHRIVDLHRHFFAAQKRDAGRERELGGHGTESEPAGLINLLVASMTTPSAAFSRNVREERLHDALNQLPDDQREVLKLRYVDSLPTKVIAEQLNKSDVSIRVMLTRSLKKLQTLLE